MEVMIQTLPIIQSKFDLDLDFDFNSTPFSNSTAPSTPKRRFHDSFYFSAPTSPTTKASEFSPDFNDHRDDDDAEDDEKEVGSKSVIPFDWEEKPGIPKSLDSSKLINDDDFAFNFSSELEKASLPAEELFHGGKIKPLKPPPGFSLNEFAKNQNPISSKSPKASFFSPKMKKKQSNEKIEHETRGRELISKNSSRRLRETRSLSPYRVNSHYPFDESENLTSSSSSTTTTTKNSSKNRKWSLRNFLLFRSASEGRAGSDKKDPLRKYFSFFRKHNDGDGGSGSGKHSRLQKQQKTESFNSGLMKKRVSAHEMLYMKNRAVSEDLKKRSFLPYKHGIMGRFSFNYVSSN